MYEKEKTELLSYALKLEQYSLITLSGGNVSCRIPGTGHFIVSPSGLAYEGLVPDDFVVVDIEGNKVEGKLKTSVDTVALMYIFNNMPEVNAVIHTHQVYATAVGTITDELPAVTTTLCNAVLGAVTVAPFSSAASLQMGIESVENLNGKRAVILKNHGVITVGGTIKEALYAAVYLEDTAKVYLAAKAVANPVILNDFQVDEAVEVFNHYGQDRK
jgi:L-ribulose-5-phosphate 4-epimerase